MFEEEEKWSWEKTIEATRSDTLEWGDEKESEEFVNESVIEKEGQLEQSEVSGSGSSTSTYVNNPRSREDQKKTSMDGRLCKR